MQLVVLMIPLLAKLSQVRVIRVFYLWPQYFTLPRRLNWVRGTLHDSTFIDYNPQLLETPFPICSKLKDLTPNECREWALVIKTRNMRKCVNY